MLFTLSLFASRRGAEKTNYKMVSPEPTKRDDETGDGSPIRQRNSKNDDFSSPSLSSSSSPRGTSSRDEDDDSDDDDDDREGEDEYKKGGYHRVSIGDCFHENRYRIERKLGWGHFSTVWIVSDLKRTTKEEEKEKEMEFEEENNKHTYALKIQKSASHYLEAARDEIEILKQIASGQRKENEDDDATRKNEYSENAKHVVQLVDSFEHIGENGTHVCMVFELSLIHI